MSDRVLKSWAIIALSLAFLYSGAAWAVEACVRHGGHTDYAIAHDHNLPQVSLNRLHPHESVPVIHCTAASEQIGPVARVASTQIRRSDNGVAFHADSLPRTHSAVLRNDLWLEAVFRKTAEFFLPSDLARYLFLSVLQI